MPVPVDGDAEAVGHGVFGSVAQKIAGLVDAGQGVGDVAGAVGTVGGLDGADGFVLLAEVLAQVGDELVEGGAFAEGGVVDLIYGGGVGGGHGQHIHLDDVVDVGEVAGILAVAVDVGGLVLHELLHEQGNYGGISSVGVLAASEDIEIAQADVFELVGAGEDVGIELVDVLGYGIGRKRLADYVLDLRKRLGVAVGARRGCEDEALYAGVARGDNHVEETADIDVVGRDGVLYRARYGAQGSLVHHVVDAVDGLSAVVEIADIADLELELPGIFLDKRNEIIHVPGGEIVQTADLVAMLEQVLAQI